MIEEASSKKNQVVNSTKKWVPPPDEHYSNLIIFKVPVKDLYIPVVRLQVSDCQYQSCCWTSQCWKVVVHEGYWDWGQKSQFWSSIPRCVDHWTNTHRHTNRPTHTHAIYQKHTPTHTDIENCMINNNLSEMCEAYSALPEEDKFVIACAPNLGKFLPVFARHKKWQLLTGFFKAEHYLVSNTVQFNLTTMARVAIDDCILVSNVTRDSVPFAMR